MAPTIKDVASKANVSYNTVSEIINLGREKKFAPGTVEKVKEAAEKLGYGTNHFARSLKTGRTFLVGVSGMAKRILTHGFQSPYIADVYSGIAETFVDRNYKLLFHYYSTLGNLGELCELAKTKMVDGILFIVYSHKVHSFVECQATFLKEKKFPFCFLYSFSEEFDLPCVGWDGRLAGNSAAKHLLEHGYDSIHMIRVPGEEHIHLTEMEEGYKAALADYSKGAVKAKVIPVKGFSAQDGYAHADTLLASGEKLPRAYFIPDEGVANGMIQRFREASIRIPEDLAIITCGSPLNDKVIMSDLTYLEADGRKKGQVASERLLDLIEHPEKIAQAKSVILKPELVVKKSCGCK